MAFKIVSQPETPQMGFGTSILRNIINPFRRTLGQGTELGFDIGEKLGVGDRSKAVNPFLNTEESQKLNSGALNYLTQSARNAAGVGANFIPFGQGASLATRAILPGAVAGGAQAFGEGTNVLGGAATGGIFGGILGKLLGTKAEPGIQAAKSKLFGEATPTVTGAALDNTPGFTKRLAENTALAQEIGITDRMPSTQKTSLIGTTFKKFQDDIALKLKGSQPVPQMTILENLSKNYANSNIDETSGPTKRLVDLILGKLQSAAGDNVKLNALKSEAREEMGNLFTGGASSAKKDVWEVVYNTVKDSLDTVDDEIRTINQKQRGLFDLAAEFVPAAKASAENVGIKVPFTNAVVPTPLNAEGTNRFLGKVGRVAASPVTAPTKAFLGGAERLPAADSALGGSLLNATSRLPATLLPQPGQQPDTVPSAPITSLTTTTQPNREVDGQNDMLNTLLQLGVASGDITPTAAKFILEQRGGGKQTEAQIARDSVGQLVGTAIKQLDTTGAKAGPIAPRVEEFKSRFNAGDQSTLDLNNTISQIKAGIAKARAGTSFTPNEEVLLNQYTPVVGDSKQQIKTKLLGLQQTFDNHNWDKAGTAIDATSLQDLLQ